MAYPYAATLDQVTVHPAGAAIDPPPALSPIASTSPDWTPTGLLTVTVEAPRPVLACVSPTSVIDARAVAAENANSATTSTRLAASRWGARASTRAREAAIWR